MKQRSAWTVMSRLIGLVRPLAPFMILAIFLGTVGFLCSTFLTILGGYAMLEILGYGVSLSLTALFVLVAVFAVLRGFLRYGHTRKKQGFSRRRFSRPAPSLSGKAGRQGQRRFDCRDHL